MEVDLSTTYAKVISNQKKSQKIISNKETKLERMNRANERIHQLTGRAMSHKTKNSSTARDQSLHTLLEPMLVDWLLLVYSIAVPSSKATQLIFCGYSIDEQQKKLQGSATGKNMEGAMTREKKGRRHQ